ncbi:MAG: non-ribosomal peptide synthetase [Neomegalonema sp.]|nr:non-ribosomal peptide synthetase [Neomegalonema sp.]
MVSVNQKYPAEQQMFKYDRDMALAAGFAEAVAAYPDRVALVAGATSYRYDELDALTNQLARRLAAAGVAAGSVVATLTERSAETVILWLAIIKCGGVYLPYDPAYPLDTLRFMISDAQPVIAIADKAFDRDAAGDIGAPLYSVEDEIAAAANESAAPFSVTVDAGSAAYIMYTSGSTGKPKGVVVPHRGVVRLVREQNYMEFGPDEIWLQIAALAFDVSTLEVWGALLNGATCAIYEGSRIDIATLGDVITKYGVTSMYLTTGLFNAVIDENIEALRSLETLLVGGDVVSPEHANKLVATLPHVQLINGYGPTEATTFTTCWCAPKGKRIEGAVPIGDSLSHSTTMILDENLKPVPDGEIGFLWTGGDGVALGYLNREELTADRFRPDPFAEHEGLMYNTGDLARLTPEGAFEFLGRKDRQLKIDGKRIELDEIEHNLRADERVDDVVATLRQKNANKSIVAFIKLQEGSTDEALLQAVLDDYRGRMPAHMAPHRTILTSQMPLTPNGKIDRKKLLAMAEADAETASAAPRALEGDEERAIADVWSEVLGHPNFGRDDNFFDIGGTSLMMVRAHAALQRKIGKTVPITALFEHPRISELASALSGANAATAKRRAARDRGARQKDLLRKMRS